MSVFPFIEAETVERRNVARGCGLMEVSRPTSYDWHAYRVSRPALDDEALSGRIAAIHAESRSTYGWSRAHASCAGRVRIWAASGWPGSCVNEPVFDLLPAGRDLIFRRLAAEQSVPREFGET